MGHLHHENNEIRLLRKSFMALDEHASAASEQLRNYLYSVPEESLEKAIKELELSALSLKLVYAWFSITKEDQNISRALKAIKRERGIRYGFDDDPSDHLNYTSI